MANMTKKKSDILVINDFYDDFEKVSELSKKTEYLEEIGCVHSSTQRHLNWELQKKVEKKLGFKILNWEALGKKSFQNGSLHKISPNGNWESKNTESDWTGIIFLENCYNTDLSIMSGDIDGQASAEFTIVGSQNRLVLFPSKSYFWILGNRSKNDWLYFQLFSFNTFDRPLSDNYWHCLDRQLTFKIKPCFSKELCDEIVSESEAFKWTTQRHNQYPTTDIPVRDLENNRDKINEIINEKVLSWLEDGFCLSKNNMFIQDLFVVKYSADGQRLLKPHRDISILSFNILLNDHGEFDGGGTQFFKMNTHVNIEKGDIVMHSGALLHAGCEVTRGVRYIMVGFVGIKEDKINQKLRKELCKRFVTDDEMLANMFLY